MSVFSVVYYDNKHGPTSIKAAKRRRVGESVKEDVAGEQRLYSVSKVTPNHKTEGVLRVFI